METLETLGKRIATTTDLQSIVRTMKALSSVSIRQYERAAAAQSAYRQTIERGLQVVLRTLPFPRETAARGDVRTAAIVFGSDHGLCGAFNEQICRFARHTMERRVDNAWDRRYLAVGMQAAARLDAMGQAIDSAISLPGSVGGLTSTVHDILRTIENWQDEHDIACVVLFRNARESSAPASPAMIQLLPLDLAWLRSLTDQPWPSRVLPNHTMDGPTLFASLIREHLFSSVFRAAAESMAAEHATRLASMQAAERNIQEHLEAMNGTYRRRRQEAITEELLDVVAGFESLQSEETSQLG